MPASDSERLFTIGSLYTYPQGHTATVAKLEATELVMPTGQLVACDPFVYLPEGVAPFHTAVSPAPARYRDRSSAELALTSAVCPTRSGAV